ncbi:VanW family protein [Heyndrickxia vini]|uniref:VanW family protein n=1 Tax=Heyndrickxia vini TaxID=1476025 RepID=A0ABX7E631_9BACI|nr:VanW family protein [Heyndrickxia vini]QQZ10705.1 VanW family protein [Heyndrickxia vini]
MNYKRFLIIFTTLIVCTVYLFAFSHFGALAYNTFLNPTKSFLKGTTIGPINMEGKTAQEAKELLTSEIQQWNDQLNITEEYMEKKESIQSSFILFDINETINRAESGEKNQIIVRIPEAKLKSVILEAFPELDEDSIDFTSIRRYLSEQAATLTSTDVNISIENFIAGEANNQAVVAESLRNDTSLTKGLKAFCKQISTIEIKNNTQFSLNDFLKKNQLKLSNKDVNIISSLLYELVLQTNFPIIEKNQSSNLPDYIHLGYEAKVDSALNQDFIFANPNKTTYTLTFQQIDNGLYVDMKGIPFAYKYNAVVKDKKTFSPKTIEQYSALLPEGTVNVKEIGKNGVLVKMIREVHNQAGELISSEMISEDFYPPHPRIEIHSLQAAKKDETPEDTATIDDKIDSTIDSSDESIDTNNEESSSTSPTNLEDGKSSETSDKSAKDTKKTDEIEKSSKSSDVK